MAVIQMKRHYLLPAINAVVKLLLSIKTSRVLFFLALVRGSTGSPLRELQISQLIFVQDLPTLLRSHFVVFQKKILLIIWI